MSAAAKRVTRAPHAFKAHKPATVIYRQVSFSLAAFDRLKCWQRHMETVTGQRFTNGEVLDRLILAIPLPDTFLR